MPSDSIDRLRMRALGARSAGAWDQAVASWRALLRQDPDDWEAALALRADLAALGRYAEGDPVFRQARRRFPDGPWVAHVSSLYAFPQGELPSLIARARTLASARPDEPALHTLLGDMLNQARDYAGAASAYAGDRRPEARAWEAQARSRETLRRWLAQAPPSGPATDIAVINLDRNTDRLTELDRQFSACLPHRFRVPGVEGSRLSAAAIGRLGGDAAMRGTLGCFLSHAAAWEAMLARGLAQCLIVEDDVIPLFDLPAQWGMFGVPDEADICFVNDRLAPQSAEAGFRVRTLSEAMLCFPSWRNAPGADGYRLSAAGAQKLLDWVARDGFAGDVDWRLLGYGLTQEQIEALPADSHARWALPRLPQPASPDRLSAVVLSPPLIRTVPVASDREDENRAGSVSGARRSGVDKIAPQKGDPRCTP